MRSIELIQQLPKTDLHCHLDGSLRLDTILELAPQAEASSCRRSIAASCSACSTPASTSHSLDDYLGVRHHAVGDADRGGARAHRLRAGRGRLARERALHRGALLADAPHARRAAAGAGRRGGAARAAHRQARVRHPLRRDPVRHPLDRAPSQSLRMAELCVAFKNRGVVGFDLAGSRGQQPGQGAPPGVPARDRQQHQLHRPRRRGVRSRLDRSRRSTSAARTASATARGSSRTAICSTTSTITASRSRCARRRTCRPRAATSWETHPVDFFVDYGLRVTINTDNRLITDTTVSKEL